MNRNETPFQSNDGSLKDVAVTIPIIEEHLEVGKKVIETGRVIINKKVKEEKESIEVSLSHDEFKVEHIPINQFADGVLPTIRQEGNSTFIPVLKEVMVKRILLVEEIKITRHIISTTEHVEVALQKESISVSRKE